MLAESGKTNLSFSLVFLEPGTLDLFFDLYHSLPPMLSQLVSDTVIYTQIMMVNSLFFYVCTFSRRPCFILCISILWVPQLLTHWFSAQSQCLLFSLGFHFWVWKHSNPSSFSTTMPHRKYLPNYFEVISCCNRDF